MNHLELLKVLANQSRLSILHYLKTPEKYFVHKTDVDMSEVGVCVEEVQRVTGLSQSATSTYMNMMRRVGLVEATRIGKYTYFKRNEDVLKELAQYISQDL